MKKHDLEERLINFAVLIVEIVESMPNTKAANHLGSIVAVWYFSGVELWGSSER